MLSGKTALNLKLCSIHRLYCINSFFSRSCVWDGMVGGKFCLDPIVIYMYVTIFEKIELLIDCFIQRV